MLLGGTFYLASDTNCVAPTYRFWFVLRDGEPLLSSRMSPSAPVSKRREASRPEEHHSLSSDLENTIDLRW